MTAPLTVVRIALQNFMPFEGDHEIRISTGPVLVAAPNFHGKSSLLESIGWCLYGAQATRFRSKDAVIHNAQKTAIVEVELSDGTVVTRFRSRGSADRLEISTGTAVEISALLGIDADGYAKLCHLDQGASLTLAHSTEAVRRDIILGWIGASSRRWERAAEVVAARVAALRVELEQKRGVAAYVRGLGSPLPASARAQLESAVTIAERELAQARDELDVLSLRAAAKDAAARLAAAQSALRDASIPEDDITARREAETHAIETEVAARRRADAVTRLAVLGFDGRCPMTATTCPVPDEVGRHRAAIEARARDAVAEAEAARAARAGAEAARARLEREERELARLRDDYERARAAFVGARDAYEMTRSVVGDTRADVPAVEARLAAIQERRAEMMGALEADDAIVAARRDLPAVETEISRLETQLAGALLLSRALAAVPGPVADAVAAVEAAAGAMLDGTGLAVRIGWRRDTARWTPGCRCGYLFPSARARECAWCGAERQREQVPAFDVLVNDGDGWDDVRFKSGAAKAMVLTALRLAAGAANPDLRVGWRNLDEGFGELDRERAAGLARLLERAPLVGVGQVLVVSHDPALAHAIRTSIRIERHGGGRRIVIP